MRSSVFITVSVIALSALAFNYSAIEHTVVKEETAWFLSSVFYGKGSDYKKILDSNHLTNPDQIKVGMVLKIEQPLFEKSNPGFAQRYTDLWEKRAAALEVRNRIPASTEVSKTTVIPVEKIRGKDTTNGLPFTEMINPQGSPSEMAVEEIFQRKSRKANPESGH